MWLTAAGSNQADPLKPIASVNPNAIRARTRIGSCRFLVFTSLVYFALQSGHTRYTFRL